MIRPQPMIVVDDVMAASRWFQDVLGLTSGHGGDEYEMLMDGNVVVAQLHHWEADEHPHLGDHDNPSRGNGILLWFDTDELDRIIERAERQGADVLEAPWSTPTRTNENSGSAPPTATRS